MRYYIFAANAKHADYYAKRLGLGGINQPNVIYVSDVHLLYGLQKTEDVKFIFYETFWDHPKALDIKLQVNIIEATSPSQRKDTTGGGKQG